jgi:hypothetical protein
MGDAFLILEAATARNGLKLAAAAALGLLNGFRVTQVPPMSSWLPSGPTS